MEINKADYPSNSFNDRQRRLEEKANQIIAPSRKVVKGTVVRKPKSFLARLGQKFFGNDTDSVTSYIVWEVLVPAAKSTLTDMVSSGIEMLLYGESTNTGRKRRGLSNDRPVVNYGSMYRGGRDRDEPRPESRKRNRFDFDDIVIETRGDAEGVLTNMLEAIDKYDVVTVADYYDFLGMDSVFSEQKYGWTNLSRAVIRRTPKGFVILLPPPEVLD